MRLIRLGEDLILNRRLRRQRQVTADKRVLLAARQRTLMEAKALKFQNRALEAFSGVR